MSHKLNLAVSHSPVLNCVQIAQDVLENEANALKALSLFLDNTFNKAVDLIAKTKGRIIVSGIGKSGHIARKIAATFASTGQPAFFIHPTEASHGDLGMLTEEDTILALSNSGETVEFGDMINYSRRFSIPLIGITSRPQSTLATLSDVTLLLPSLAEACPMGLAPTTSTTMMIALGDALAIALLSLKGFSASDFKRFHPGGNLGQQLLRVSDKMHKGDKIPLCSTTDSVKEVLLVMTAKGFGCVGVLDTSQNLVGIITDGDLRRHMDQNLLTLQAIDIMTKNPLVVFGSLLMSEALALMNKKSITSLFIVESETSQRPQGIIHIHDFLRAGIA